MSLPVGGLLDKLARKAAPFVSPKKKSASGAVMPAAHRTVPPATKYHPPTPAPRERYRQAAGPRTDPNRRVVTFAIVVGGVLIAVWVLAMSLGVGGGSTAVQQGSGASSPPAVDAKALEATVAGLQERLRQNPADTGVMIALGNAYYDAARWTEAIPWYEKALQAVPANTDVRTDLGTAYFYSGDIEKAKEQWFKSLEYDPDKVQTHYNLGVLYSHLTPPDTEAAAREWETVLRLAPNSEQAKSAEKNLTRMGKR